MVASTAFSAPPGWSVCPGIRWSISRGIGGQFAPESGGQYQRILQQRVAPELRIDNRKEALKKHLQMAIQQSKDVQQVKKYMKNQGYAVELGRGIAFTDAQHVRFKGSQVGYALMDIEKKLKQQQLSHQQEQNRQAELLRQQQAELKQQQQQKEQPKEKKQEVQQYKPRFGR